MTIELTEQQRRALAEAGDTPPTITDPETNTEYVLVRADVYAKLRAVVDGMTKRVNQAPAIPLLVVHPPCTGSG